MLTTILISNSPAFVTEAQKAGVDRIWCDLEILGKTERQGHLNTVISHHTLADVARVREVTRPGALMVRTNPLHPGIGDEIEAVLARGADLLMLPMFRTATEVAEYVRLVNGRAKIVPLVETAGAAEQIADIAKMDRVSEVFIGLNDLHLDLGMTFMFELLANGTVENLMRRVRPSGKPVGFGGVGKPGKGELDAGLIISEHVRLQSSGVILSRSFHGGAANVARPTPEQLKEFQTAMEWLRSQERRLSALPEAELDANRAELARVVGAIARARKT